MWGFTATKARSEWGETIGRSARILASSADISISFAGIVFYELIEAEVKAGICQKSILVTLDVVEPDVALSGSEDQPPLLVDGVSYPHLPAILALPLAERSRLAQPAAPPCPGTADKAALPRFRHPQESCPKPCTGFT